MHGYGNYNSTDLDTAWSQTLVTTNEIIRSKLQNKVIVNKSWFTVYDVDCCCQIILFYCLDLTQPK